MSGVSRRRFLKGAAAAAAVGATTAATIAGSARPASAATVPVVNKDRRVVVIGSGFGGSVTALRLARAGIPVLLLERGIWWPTGPDANTFARMFSPDQRCSWLTTSPVLPGAPPAVYTPFTGVLDRVAGNGMDIICGAGVGGGSLVYHGMTLQPTESVFAEVLPMLDYGELSQTYYPTVAKMLSIATIPDDVLNSPQYLSNQVFVQHIEAAGLSPSKIPMPIDWNYARAELQGAMTPAHTTGDVIYGVNNGGKHSLDVTYLAQALATGLVEIDTLNEVQQIARNGQGKWVITSNQINTGGVTQLQNVITADALFMGAGVAGTTRLLMRAQANNTIPDLPDGLGTQVGNNGDRIYAWEALTENTGAPQGGPACMGYLDWASPGTALTIVHGPVPIPVESHIMSIIGYGVTPVRGAFQWDSAAGDAVLTYPTNTETDLNNAILARVNQIMDSTPGVLVDTTATDPTTYHPLGGAPMGSVCDQYGRVLGQKGLYVMDGSLIPGSAGACNPSMTIAAVAERSIATVIKKDVGTVF